MKESTENCIVACKLRFLVKNVYSTRPNIFYRLSRCAEKSAAELYDTTTTMARQYYYSNSDIFKRIQVIHSTAMFLRFRVKQLFLLLKLLIECQSNKVNPEYKIGNCVCFKISKISGFFYLNTE